MMRLLIGKFSASAGVPIANSLTTQPFGGDARGERPVAPRIDHVEPGADDGDRAGAAGQGGLVRGGVDAERQPRDDDPAGLAQMRREGACVVESLRRRIAAADDRHRRRLEQLDPAAHIEQERRIGGIEEELRVARIADDDGVARLVAAAEPLPAGVSTGRELVRNAAERGGNAGTDDFLAGSRRRRERRLGRAEASQQRARRLTADTGRLEQAQPRREFVAIDHVRAPAPRRSKRALAGEKLRQAPARVRAGRRRESTAG